VVGIDGATLGPKWTTVPLATENFVKTSKSEWMWLCCCWLEEDKRTKKRWIEQQRLGWPCKRREKGGVCDDTQLRKEKAGIELLLVEHYAN